MTDETKKTETPKAKPEEEKNLFAEEVEKTKDNLETSAPETEQEETSDEDEMIETKEFSKKDKVEYKQEYEKIRVEEAWPDSGKVLTIEKVYPQGVKKSDIPIKSPTGAYFKKKLMVCFNESRKLSIDGKDLDLKFREPVPSVTYGIDNEGNIGEPRIPKACEKDDLDDMFTSLSKKMRYHYYKAFPKTDEKQSDYDYVESLVGKKVLVIKKIGKWKKDGKDVKYAKLVIQKFVE